MPKIIYKDKNLVVINKPVGMPSQADPTKVIDAMSATGEILAGMGESSELFLIHRLDRGVGGLMVFARNKRYASELSTAIAQKNFTKEYLAVAKGVAKEGVYTDYLFKDSATNKSYVVKTQRKGAKYAELSLVALSVKEINEAFTTLIRVKLATGRHHQIRVQLASRGTSLIGDKKYGGADLGCKGIALFAFSLSFSAFGKEYSFVAKPNTESYPWSNFKSEVESV